MLSHLLVGARIHVDAMLHRLPTSPMPWSPMADIATDRKGAPRDRALAFLEYITEDHLILLAMFAEMGDEAMEITRMLDDPTYDAAELPKAIDAFLQRLHLLFVSGECVQIDGSVK